MNKIETYTPLARNWRDIPQQIAPEAMSKVGRRRSTLQTLRNGAIVFGALALVVGGFGIWRMWQDDPQRLLATTASEPLKHIEVVTDGVLDREWVIEQMALPKESGLMELDLYALRTRLMKTGQVNLAILTRQFPDTLKVMLEERSPVVRVKARLDGPEIHIFLVSREGTVFRGHGFRAETLGALPWLGGVRLVRNGEGYQPLTGLSQVADLLGTVRAHTPDLFSTWRVISLERLELDGEIEVQTSAIQKIIFGTREGFFAQVARLDLILSQTRVRQQTALKSINLAVGASQVPVAMMARSLDSTPTGQPSVFFPLN
jgi:hypothetical protein